MKRIFIVGLILISVSSIYAATLNDVQKFVSENKFPEAIAACNDILAQKPGNINALRWLAYSNYKSGNYDGVIEITKNNDIKDAEISNMIGLAYIAKNNVSEAEKEFNNAIVYDKNFVDSYLNKAQIYINNKDFSNAKSYLVTANTIDPKNIKNLINLGYVNIELKQYDNAIANLIKAKNIDPKNQDLLANLGNAYFSKGDYKNALKEYNELYEINVNNELAISGLACSYAALGNNSEAQKFYDIIIKSSNSFNANYNMGIILKKQNKFGEAVNYFAKAMELQPNDLDTLNELAWCQFKSGKSAEAIESLNKVLTLSQENITSLSYLGAIYSNLNKPNEAYSNWSRCVIISPNNADFKVNLGNVCIDLEKYDEAIAAYKSALSINPKVANANLGLGIAILQKSLSEEKVNVNLVKEAMNVFKTITQNEPKNYIAWVNLGVCYQKTNKNNEAMAAYEKALAINPKSVEAKTNIDELNKVIKK